MLHYRTRLPGMSSAESLGPHASSCWACRRPWLSDLAGPEGLPMTWLAHSVQMTARALIGSASQHSGNNCGAPSLNEYKPVGLGSSGMYPRFAIITEETQPSAAPETLPIEIEIGALIKKAGESLRDQSRSSTSDVDKTHSRSPSAPQEGESAGSSPKLFDITVKDTGQEAPIWDLTIGDADRIPDPSRSTKTTRLALVAGALVGTFITGAISGIAVEHLNSGTLGKPEREGYFKTQLVRTNKDTYDTGETRPKSPPASLNTRPTAKANARTDQLDQLQSANRRSAGAHQNTGSSKATASSAGRAMNPSGRPVAFPETRPTTIEGWTVRDVIGGTATLEGPDGVWRVTRGDEVPGVGSVNSILRWGGRWIVATNGGLIATP